MQKPKCSSSSKLCGMRCIPKSSQCHHPHFGRYAAFYHKKYSSKIQKIYNSEMDSDKMDREFNKLYMKNAKQNYKHANKIVTKGMTRKQRREHNKKSNKQESMKDYLRKTRRDRDEYKY